ncbi:fibro-slime domain-containing protein [Sorangium sp. So ce726]|uniref:fibro-slime domain-containing protein n=1 Tax=Sorangium sp. So ce726 TaxID=3133319 RepID=UPI003F6113A6
MRQETISMKLAQPTAATCAGTPRFLAVLLSTGTALAGCTTEIAVIGRDLGATTSSSPASSSSSSTAGGDDPGILDPGAGGGSPQGTTGAGGDEHCEPKLAGVLRDFKAWNSDGGHPDFEWFSGDGLKGIVQAELGPDDKPVYAHEGGTEHTTGPEAFYQWYHDDPTVNVSFRYDVPLQVSERGLGSFLGNQFFPLDDRGWGNEGNIHNFGFTYELHMTFDYQPGGVFFFNGDDDLWVFINRRLAIDMGGLHVPTTALLDLDAHAEELGIEVGKEYPLDFFYAERRGGSAVFTIVTSFKFTNCKPILR